MSLTNCLRTEKDKQVDIIFFAEGRYFGIVHGLIIRMGLGIVKRKVPPLIEVLAIRTAAYINGHAKKEE